jgi:bacteriocin-like protein
MKEESQKNSIQDELKNNELNKISGGAGDPDPTEQQILDNLQKVLDEANKDFHHHHPPSPQLPIPFQPTQTP